MAKGGFQCLISEVDACGFISFIISWSALSLIRNKRIVTVIT